MANNSSEYIYFEHMEAPHVSKYLMMAFATVAIVVSTPFILAAISFGQIGNRLLTDRLVTSNFITLLLFNFFVQVLTLVRYLYGPFSPGLCQIDYLVKNILVLKVISFANFALAVRYIFVVHSRNPTAVQDVFWSIFLETWTIGFATLCQVAYLFLPGRDPMFYYFCLGKMPKTMLSLKTKPNPAFTLLSLVTIISHFLSYVYLQLIKRKEELNEESKPKGLFSFLQGNIEKEQIYSFASNVAGIMVLIASAIMPSIINSIAPADIKEFPNYIVAYVHHLMLNGCAIFALMSIYYLKRPKLRNQFKRLFLARFNRNENF